MSTGFLLGYGPRGAPSLLFLRGRAFFFPVASCELRALPWCGGDAQSFVQVTEDDLREFFGKEGEVCGPSLNRVLSDRLRCSLPWGVIS